MSCLPGGADPKRSVAEACRAAAASAAAQAKISCIANHPRESKKNKGASTRGPSTIGAMFANVWQKPLVDVFQALKVYDSNHANDGAIMLLKGDVKKHVDRSIGKHVFHIQGKVSSANMLQLPGLSTSHLALTGPYMYIQMMVADPTQFWSFHVELTTSSGVSLGGLAVKRTMRLSFGNVFKSQSIQARSMQFPVHSLVAEKWTYVAIHLPGLLRKYSADEYVHVKNLQFCANMTVRNVFMSYEEYTASTCPQAMRLLLAKGTDWDDHYKWCWLGGRPVVQDHLAQGDSPQRPTSPSTHHLFLRRGEQGENVNSLNRSPTSVGMSPPLSARGRQGKPLAARALGKGGGNKIKAQQQQHQHSYLSESDDPLLSDSGASRSDDVSSRSDLSRFVPNGANSGESSLRSESTDFETEDNNDSGFTDTSWEGGGAPVSPSPRAAKLGVAIPSQEQREEGEDASYRQSPRTLATTKNSSQNQKLAQEFSFVADDDDSLITDEIAIGDLEKRGAIEDLAFLGPNPCLEMQHIIGITATQRLPNATSPGMCTPLAWSPDGMAAIYANTSSVIIQPLTQKSDSAIPQQMILSAGPGGRPIGVVAVSKNGLLATAEGVCATGLDSKGAKKPSPAHRGPAGLKYPLVKVWDMVTGMCLSTLSVHYNDINTMAFSEQGRELVVVGHNQAQRQLVVVWDISRIKTGVSLTSRPEGEVTLLARQVSEYSISRIIFAPMLPPQPNQAPQRLNLISCGHRSIRFWRVKNKHLPAHSLPLNQYAGYSFTCLDIERQFTASTDRLAPNIVQQRLFVASTDGSVFQVNYALRVLECVFKLHDAAITSLSISDGFCATSSLDSYFRVWPLEFSHYYLQTQHKNAVHAVSISPDGLKVLVADESGSMGYVDLSSNQYKTQLRSNQAQIKAVAIDPFKEQFTTIAEDGCTKIWDLQTYAQLFEFENQANEEGLCLAYHPTQENILVCGFSSGFIRVFDVVASTQWFAHQHHTGRVLQVAFDVKGEMLFSSGEDGYIGMHDTNGEYYCQLVLACPILVPVALHAAFAINAAPGASSSATLLRPSVARFAANGSELPLLHNNNPIFPPGFHPALYLPLSHSLCLSLDGKLLAVVGSDAVSVVLYSLVSMKIIRCIQDAASVAISKLCFSPDSCQILVFGAQEKRVRCYVVGSGRQIHQVSMIECMAPASSAGAVGIKKHKQQQVGNKENDTLDFCAVAAVSPNGLYLASATFAQATSSSLLTIRQYPGSERYAMTEDEQTSTKLPPFQAAIASYNSEKEALNSSNNTKSKVLQSFAGHYERIADLVWSRDGAQIITVGGSTITVWQFNGRTLSRSFLSALSCGPIASTFEPLFGPPSFGSGENFQGIWKTFSEPPRYNEVTGDMLPSSEQEKRAKATPKELEMQWLAEQIENEELSEERDYLVNKRVRTRGDMPRRMYQTTKMRNESLCAWIHANPGKDPRLAGFSYEFEGGEYPLGGKATVVTREVAEPQATSPWLAPEPHKIVGYNGLARNNACWHPETRLFVYSSAQLVIMETLLPVENSHDGGGDDTSSQVTDRSEDESETGLGRVQQRLLQGHTSDISTLAVSQDGGFIASASCTPWDSNNKNSDAPFINIWDATTAEGVSCMVPSRIKAPGPPPNLPARLRKTFSCTSEQVRRGLEYGVQLLVFDPQSILLLSVGCMPPPNSEGNPVCLLCIWDWCTGVCLTSCVIDSPIYSASWVPPPSAEVATSVSSSEVLNGHFITSGESLLVWSIQSDAMPRGDVPPVREAEDEEDVVDEERQSVPLSSAPLSSVLPVSTLRSVSRSVTTKAKEKYSILSNPSSVTVSEVDMFVYGLQPEITLTCSTFANTNRLSLYPSTDFTALDIAKGSQETGPSTIKSSNIYQFPCHSVVAGTVDGRMFIWAADGSLQACWSAADVEIESIQVCQNGVIIVGSAGGSIERWLLNDPRKGHLAATASLAAQNTCANSSSPRRRPSPYALSLSNQDPDESLAAYSKFERSADDNMEGHEGLQIDLIFRIDVDGGVHASCFDTSGSIGVVGTSVGTIWHVDFRHCSRSRLVNAHSQTITSIAVHPAEKVFCSTSYDGSVRVWRLALGQAEVEKNKDEEKEESSTPAAIQPLASITSTTRNVAENTSTTTTISNAWSSPSQGQTAAPLVPDHDIMQLLHFQTQDVKPLVAAFHQNPALAVLVVGYDDGSLRIFDVYYMRLLQHVVLPPTLPYSYVLPNANTLAPRPPTLVTAAVNAIACAGNMILVGTDAGSIFFVHVFTGALLGHFPSNPHSQPARMDTETAGSAFVPTDIKAFLSICVNSHACTTVTSPLSSASSSTTTTTTTTSVWSVNDNMGRVSVWRTACTVTSSSKDVLIEQPVLEHSLLSLLDLQEEYEAWGSQLSFAGPIKVSFAPQDPYLLLITTNSMRGNDITGSLLLYDFRVKQFVDRFMVPQGVQIISLSALCHSSESCSLYIAVGCTDAKIRLYRLPNTGAAFRGAGGLIAPLALVDTLASLPCNMVLSSTNNYLFTSNGAQLAIFSAASGDLDSKEDL